mmetsp:Transcript_3261/g.4184  ORF Transcript_3261/g.4184 Transcript_3261/m.4184 type:complete len:343 (-) Transcript_3261:27-1055(-)|eukprot:CAMPEP_0172498718 /NCGR_PEP_ID=MMETSP1066-20121228/116505_1 /TAXON_ID=671091 /ORGANISM="Coscinodiscus wailesii, Strain CCMP2513" /LENGTH=342 /DNA_ID=CAMNT_0013272119 /DNA_START=31 /DNA_END=1059 /DNA_ORIENTATION=-
MAFLRRLISTSHHSHCQPWHELHRLQKALASTSIAPSSAISKSPTTATDTPNKKNIKNYSSWDDRLDDLQEFHDQNGHSRVPQNYSNNPHLATRVKNQRALSTTTLAPTRAKLNFAWKPATAGWTYRFEQLLRFKKEHGHCNVPYRYDADPSLGLWVSSQRCDYKLWKEQNRSGGGGDAVRPPERFEALTREGFVWDVRELMWNEKLRLLEEFIAEHGHARVPQKYKGVGRWVDKQRQNYKKMLDGKPCGSMTKERAAILNKLGFVWDIDEYNWWEKYGQVRVFAAKNGGRMPAHSHRLGKWLLRQQNNYESMSRGKESTMTRERVDALKHIGYHLDFVENE